MLLNNRNLLAITVLIVISTVTLHSVFAQQPQPAIPAEQSGPAPNTYTLQVNAQAVVLDVVVTGKKGQIVNNLSKDDFQVYEDKVPQIIRTLDAPQSHAAPANIPINSTVELDKLEPTAPVTIIVLDEINTRFEDEAFARYSLKKFLDTQGDTLQQPTMFVAVSLQRFMVLRDYTTSKQEILSALDHHLTIYPWHLQGGSWKTEQYNAAFASLMEVAEATAGHPGHKSMIWIGRGFPAVDPATLSPEAGDALKTAIETCTNSLRDARVVLYTLDPAGVPYVPAEQDADGFYEDDPFGGEIDFNEMAAATGGHSFYGRNDVDQLIAASTRDAAGFYTLSYTPSVARTDAKAFHNIRVVMKDPNLRAATREGYYAIAPPPPPDTASNGKLSDRQVFDLTVAAQSMMIYDAVPLTITRIAANPNQFKVGFNSADLVWQETTPGKLTADITILVETFDKKGKMLNRTAEISTAQVAESSTPNVPVTPRVNLLSTIPTQPPAARIRFVVRIDRNQKLGAANFFLVDQKTLSDPTTGLTPGKH